MRMCPWGLKQPTKEGVNRPRRGGWAKWPTGRVGGGGGGHLLAVGGGSYGSQVPQRCRPKLRRPHCLPRLQCIAELQPPARQRTTAT